MIPHLNWRQRIVAWLLWHFEGYRSTDDARFNIIEHPDLSRTSCLMRDYWYAKRAKEYE